MADEEHPGRRHAQETTDAAPEPRTEWIGGGVMPERVGRYRLRRVIASGGMGVVYEAIQDHPRRSVALKIVRAGLATRSALG